MVLNSNSDNTMTQRGLRRVGVIFFASRNSLQSKTIMNKIYNRNVAPINMHMDLLD